MRKVVAGLLGAAMVSTVGIMLPAVAQAAPPEPVADSAGPAKVDDLPNPLEQKRRELRQEAVNGILKGTVKAEKRGVSMVANVGKTNGRTVGGRAAKANGRDQYVELAREKTDRIFVILAEFGNERHPDFPDVDSDPETPGPTTWDGPVHNQIAKPDRTVDTKTIWQPDYNRDHFQQLYFGEGADAESLKTYYEKASSGRYSVDGEVTDWVKVKYNEARYGRDCDIHGNCTDAFAWELVKDAANKWVEDQRAAGRTEVQIKADLATFDQWDRYDYDGDGNFNEPDGYLDHFQIVHAGGDNADQAPAQGEDAIWSHRWFAYQNSDVGPPANRNGGTQIGDTGFWIGDYTVQPENGGLSVFAHEYGHDLGLPDDYDTTGALNNATEFWTLMSQSRLSDTGEPNGTKPGDLGAWNKMQLGWLDYELVKAGQKKTINLGPQEYNTAKAQGAVVVLPDIEKTTDMGPPFAGAKQWFSGNDNDLDNTLTKSVDLTSATTASFDLKGRFNIEEDFDYMYFEASTDGKNWTALDGTINGAPIGTDGSQTPKPALDGVSTDWASISIPLTQYAGQRIQLRLHYVTDGGLAPGGFFGDDLTITANGTTQSVDGAEGALTWAAKGFSAVGAAVTASYDNFYIMGNRSYTAYDKYLKTGPYNFGWTPDKPNLSEHFAYQQGLLISYNNTYWKDNNTSVHPGEGLNLIIDSHPQPIYNIDGQPFRSRVMLYDAPFSLTKADSFTLHVAGKPSYIRGKAAQPLFDDTRSYFDPAIPYAGVKVAGAGVKVRVIEQDGTSLKIRIS